MKLKLSIHAPAVIPSVQWGVTIRDYDQWWPPGTADKFPKGVRGLSRPSRNKANLDQEGLPATNRAVNADNVKLTKTLQSFMHTRSCERAGLSTDNKYAKMSFASFTRGNAYAFDFVGSKTQHDWINNTHEDAGDIEFKEMWTSGALHEIIGDQREAGIECWVTKGINVWTEDVWRYTLADLGSYYDPTTSRREMQSNGVYRENIVIPFHHYNDKVMMWAFSNKDYLLVPKYRVQLIKSLADRPPIYVL